MLIQMIKKAIGCSCGIVVCVLMIVISFIKCNDKDTPGQSSYGFIWYAMKWDDTLEGYQNPAKTRFCFYPMEQGAMIQIESDQEGLKFTLPPDKYRLLVFNSDADNIQFRNMDKFETAEAYIMTTKAANYAATGEIPLYGVVINELTVVPDEGANNKQEFTPVPLVRQVSIDVKVDGMEHIKSCKGELSGIPAALNLSKQEIVTDNLTTVNFDTAPSAEGVKANIIVLGTSPEKGETPPATTPTNEVKLDFTLEDGSNVSSTLDLGESIGQTEGNKVNIDVSVTVEKDATFTVRINNWEVSPGDDMIIE